DYLTGDQLIHLLVRTVAGGGNLLLNVGPTADGRIPLLQQERLREVGDWLARFGEGIYATRPEDVLTAEDGVHLTRTEDAHYVFYDAAQGGPLRLRGAVETGEIDAVDLATGSALAVDRESARALRVDVPAT